MLKILKTGHDLLKKLEQKIREELQMKVSDKIFPEGKRTSYFNRTNKSSINISHLEFNKENFETIIIEMLKLNEELTDCYREINHQKKRIIDLQSNFQTEISPLRIASLSLAHNPVYELELNNESLKRHLSEAQDQIIFYIKKVADLQDDLIRSKNVERSYLRVVR